MELPVPACICHGSFSPSVSTKKPGARMAMEYAFGTSLIGFESIGEHLRKCSGHRILHSNSHERVQQHLDTASLKGRFCIILNFIIHAGFSSVSNTSSSPARLAWADDTASNRTDVHCSLAAQTKASTYLNLHQNKCGSSLCFPNKSCSKDPHPPRLIQRPNCRKSCRTGPQT